MQEMGELEQRRLPTDNIFDECVSRWKAVVNLPGKVVKLFSKLYCRAINFGKRKIRLHYKHLKNRCWILPKKQLKTTNVIVNCIFLLMHLAACGSNSIL